MPSLQNDFVYDDKFVILQNNWITNIKYLPDIFSSSVWDFGEGKSNSNIYRPMMHVVYMVGYHLFELKPWGYHLISIILHSGNTIIVFFLTSAILSKQQEIAGQKPEWKENTLHQPLHHHETLSALNLAFIAALLFSAHPINTEVVSWITNSADLLMATFFLLSFSLYISCIPGLNIRFVCSVIFFILAILLKETALTLLIVIVLFDIAKENTISLFKKFKTYIPFIMVFIGYMVLRVYVLGGMTVSKKAGMGVSNIVINAFPLFFQYIKKLLLPIDLKAIYVFYPAQSLTEWTVIGTMVFTLFFLLVWSFARTRDKIVFLGLSFMVIPLIPVFYLPAIRDDVFGERYLYLPSFGFVLLISYALERICSYLRNKGLYTVLMSRGLIVLVLMVFIFYSFKTIRRQVVWENDLSLWSDTVKKSPDSYKAQNNLGMALGQQGNFKVAIAHLNKAIKIKPEYADAHNNLGIALIGIGKTGDAVPHFSKAIQLKPNFARAYHNLGFALMKQGKIDDAIVHYSEALRLRPGYTKARQGLSLANERLREKLK